MKKMRFFGIAALAVLWAALTCAAWFGPVKDTSESERRKLAQFPELTVKTVLGGKFMSEFETYTLDQFPLRDSFRQLKALFHYNALGQKDNNGIIIHEGFAAKMEYPLNGQSVEHALEKFEYLYETYLKDTNSKIYAAIAPDKGMYLQMTGYLTMDYTGLYKTVESGMPYARFVNLADGLMLEDYYRTDTHWRQEKLLATSQRLCEALGVASFTAEELTPEKVERPFYGVYHGQAALPMEAEELFVMTGPVLDQCTVYNHETGKTTGIYDWEKLSSRDLYDVYLSGAAALLTVENPNAETDKELIVFRDSFGSSLVPLLLKDYKTVTLVDIRYLSGDLLGQFVDFHGQDVLFLYSTLILNSSNTLK